MWDPHEASTLGALGMHRINTRASENQTEAPGSTFYLLYHKPPHFLDTRSSSNRSLQQALQIPNANDKSLVTITYVVTLYQHLGIM